MFTNDIFIILVISILKHFTYLIFFRTKICKSIPFCFTLSHRNSFSRCFQILLLIYVSLFLLFPKFTLFANTFINIILPPCFSLSNWAFCPSASPIQRSFQNFPITFYRHTILTTLFELLEIGTEIFSDTGIMQFPYLSPEYNFFWCLLLSVL